MLLDPIRWVMPEGYLITKVRERVGPGELPAIIVGDFNAGRNYCTGEIPEASVTIMEGDFWRPIGPAYSDEATSTEALRRLNELWDSKRGIASSGQKCDILFHDEEGREKCYERAAERMAEWYQNSAPEVDFRTAPGHSMFSNTGESL